MSSTNPTLSPKVPGAVGGGVVGSAACWALGVTAFGAPIDAAHATDAIAAVPWPLLGLLIAGLTALGGYLPRDLASTLFEGQATEDTTPYGAAMGEAAITAPAADGADVDPGPDAEFDTAPADAEVVDEQETA